MNGFACAEPRRLALRRVTVTTDNPTIRLADILAFSQNSPAFLQAGFDNLLAEPRARQPRDLLGRRAPMLLRDERT
jgi:hypothetical protein